MTSIASQSRNRACGFCTELPLFGKNKCSKHTYERKAYAAKKKSALAQAECRAAHAHGFASPAPPSPLRTCPFVHRSVAPLRTCPLLADICCGLLCLGLGGRGLLGNPIVRDRAAPTWLWNTSPTAFTARQSAAYVPNVGSRPAHAGALLFPVVDGCGDILEAAVLPSVGT